MLCYPVGGSLKKSRKEKIVSFDILWLILGALVLALTWIPAGGIAFLIENLWSNGKLKWEKRQIQIRFGWLYLIWILFHCLFLVLIGGLLLLIFLLWFSVVESVWSFCKGGWPALKAHQRKAAEELSDL